MKRLPLRRGVGVVLVNRAGKVFVAVRVDTTGAWQMPQGGIDKGETPRIAAKRELLEEIGTDKAVIVAESDGWLQYDLPPELVGKAWKGKYRGQKQKWFVMRFTGVDRDIDLDTEHPEFSRWKWIDFHRLPKVIVGFKRELYEQVVGEFAELVDKLATGKRGNPPSARKSMDKKKRAKGAVRKR